MDYMKVALMAAGGVWLLASAGSLLPGKVGAVCKVVAADLGKVFAFLGAKPPEGPK